MSDNKILEKLTDVKNIIETNQITIHTEGSHSCRYNSVCFYNSDTIFYPCGVYLIKFSLKENDIISKLIIDKSIIFNIQNANKFIIAFCYNGKGAIINPDNFEIISKLIFENGNTISNISFSLDMNYITVSVEFYKNEKKKTIQEGASLIMVKNEKNLEYKKLKLIEKKDCLTEINAQNDLILIEKVQKISNNDKNIENILSKDVIYKISLINLSNYEKNKEITKNKIEEYVLSEQYIQKNSDISYLMKSQLENILIISFYKRNVVFMDMRNLNLILSLEFEGKGCLGAIEILPKYDLYFSNKSKVINNLNLFEIFKKYEKYMNQEEHNDLLYSIDFKNNIFIHLNDNFQLDLPQKTQDRDKNEIFNFLGQCQELNIKIDREVDNNFITALNCSLKVSPDKNLICWVNEQGLSIYNKKTIDQDDQSFICKKSKINSTGVGLSINKKLNSFAVGDLEGNINIFSFVSNINEYENVNHIGTLYTGDSIRCLEWSEETNELYIGCMSGKLYFSKKYDEIEYSLILLSDFKCTITCIRVYNGHCKVLIENDNLIGNSKKLVFISTTKGEIFIISHDKNHFEIIDKFMAHYPQPENKDLRFGSLKFKAEIWSITLTEKLQNLEDNQIILNLISGSEDQTIKIFEIHIFDLLINNSNKKNKIELKIKELKSFKNHDLAVTSVDVKDIHFTNAKMKILATCSDDKVINIYNADAQEYKLLKVLNLKDDVFGWFTITYLSLEENGYRLAVVTQNGYLVIYSMIDFSLIFCEKIHLGGVEGLAWKNGRIVTCSSDLNIGIISLN